jgi:hypothetical protein
MVFFMANCCSIRRTESGFPRTRSRSRSNAAASAGSWWRSTASASGAPVSSTVPLASTSVIDSRVRYVLACVPQVIPLELLAITPPTVQADSLAGSGPSLRP